VRTRALALSLAAALVLVIAGCGSDDNESGATTTSGGGETQTFEVGLSEFKLTPSTVRIDGPGTYTFHAVNNGSIEHALEIEGENGGKVEEETETLGAGESGDVTVELAAGEYELYCPIGNHRAQGMEGKVVVGGAAGSTGTTDDNGGTTTDDESGKGYGYG
jgi:plastocyanin